MIRTVVNRKGEAEDFSPDKLNKWAEFAANSNVNWSSIVLAAIRKCYDGCKTTELHEAMIMACLDKEDPAHLVMAGRLLVGSMRKEVFGSFHEIPDLPTFYHTMVESGLWVDMGYDETELEYLDSVINHDKDFDYTYTTLKQIKDKYAIADRVSGKLFETPQFTFMGIAMAVMKPQPEERRLEDIEKLYTYLSELKINASTPFMNGPRTDFDGYASCCLIKGGDTAESIEAAIHAAYTFTCSQAGIGEMLMTRSIGDPVRGGQTVHMGKLPYYRCIDAAVKANKQLSRGGSATVHFNILDPEIEDLLRLKNPTTPDQKRINFMDYSVGVNTPFAKRVAKGEDWMTVSYHYAPDLYESMYSADNEKFEEEYNKVLNNPLIPKKMLKARDLALEIMNQRVETGRMYIHWTDAMNNHTPFKDKIYSTNLCQEIFLPTKEYKSVPEMYGYEETTGEVALCFISAIVAGRVSEEEYEDVAYYTLLMIDNIMEIMGYPFKQVGETAKKRRSVGVGITNLAHAMAKNGVKYSTKEGKNFIHRLAELHSYSLHKASLRLAKEKGNTEWIDKTKYPEGWLPIDTYNKNVDNVCNEPLHYDWETLRKEIIAQGGIRHSVLEATMPCESSSQASNTCNGVYPVRDLSIVKKSGNNKNLFIVPDYEYEDIRKNYELAWDIPTKDMIDCYAIIQKFHGQGISADFYVDYSKKENGRITSKELLQDFLYATRMGLKSQYYLNSRTRVADTKEDEVGCESCSL